MKRGQAEAQQLILITEFILGIVVVITLMYSAYEFSNNDNFVKQYIAKDVAMMMDVVMGLPGDIEIGIPLEKTREIEIGRNREFNYFSVIVDRDSISEAVFATDLDLFDEIVRIEGNAIKIIKKGSDVSVESMDISEFGITSVSESGSLGCGFDESKLGLYNEKDTNAPKDAVSEEARKYAETVLGVGNIREYGKEEVENLIRAEIVKQWEKVSDKHGASLEDAQHAILAYQHHEDSSFQMFVSKSGRLVPKHDGTTIQLLSITKDKFPGNKRKEIALNWDIQYTIYAGVRENIGAFENRVKGEGLERWKKAIGYVFLPADPNCYWKGNRAVCRAVAAEKGWGLYKDEKPYVC